MIKNIIFDLGGVFIKIHYQKTPDAFAKLGIPNFNDYFKQDFSNPLFEDLEKGIITPEQFYDGFRQLTQTQLTNIEIETAWNALLGEFWQDRLDWLNIIKNKYNVFLFSNTNSIHYDCFMKQYHLENPTRIPFNNHFKKAYYSQTLHLRKPDSHSYIAIINEQQLNVHETLFIDDTLKNIEAAKAVGLQTLHLTANMDLTQQGL